MAQNGVRMRGAKHRTRCGAVLPDRVKEGPAFGRDEGPSANAMKLPFADQHPQGSVVVPPLEGIAPQEDAEIPFPIERHGKQISPYPARRRPVRIRLWTSLRKRPPDSSSGACYWPVLVLVGVCRPPQVTVPPLERGNHSQPASQPASQR